MFILYRYLTKEIVYTFAAVITILLFVALSNHFAVLLAKAASGQLSILFVSKIVGLYIPELFAHTTPLALFIAFLLALSRMYADSEMVVLYSCGIQWSTIVRFSITIGILFAIIVTGFTMWVVPKSVVLREEAFSEGGSLAVSQTITPGRFQMLEEGRIVFYVENKNKKSHLQNVFIAQLPHEKDKKGDFTIITSSTAKFENVNDNDSENKKAYLILDKGQRYTGTPGKKDYTVVEFSEYGREIVSEKEDLPLYDRMKPTKKLLFSNEVSDKAELQWRLAMPFSVFILILLAIPLAKVNPRKGRFGKLLPAILLYIAYYNLITVSKRWLAMGEISPALGIWWVHILFLIVGLLLIAKESGRLYSLYYFWRNRK